MKDNDKNKSSLLDKSLTTAFSNCTPIVTTLEITQHCNFKCKHCYNFDRSNPMPESIKNEHLTPSEIIHAIDEIATLGSLYVNISGGEALLHPHIEDFIKRIKNHHMEPRLKTNGIMISEKKLLALNKIGLNAVDISLYASTDEVYQRFTGFKEGYSKTTQAIKKCKDLGLEINVNIILRSDNTHQLKEMIRFCESTKVNYQVSTETTERYDKSAGARDYEITNDQFEELLLGEYGHLFMVNNDDRALQCACARSVCGIGSNGDVFPCIGAPIKSGNLKEQSLKDIWSDSKELNKIRNLKEENFKECMTCDVIEYCSRSSGTCHVNGNSYTGCDPSFIAQARIRYKHRNHFKIIDSDV
jgi:radical SAM protein with 4Fe4S-binding SPASM domain